MKKPGEIAGTNREVDHIDENRADLLIRVHPCLSAAKSVFLMTSKRTRYLLHFLLACMAVFGLAAAEHHGQVKFGGLPVPGATVTATQGDKKQVAVTDSQGLYSFPDLADGVWNIEVEMLCFESLKKDIGVAAEAPSPEFDLKMLPLDQLKAVAAAAPASQEADDKKRASAPLTTTSTPAATNAKSNNKKSSAPPANPQSGFQRTDVNASPDSAPPTIASAAVDPNANASDAFVLNGSVSNRIESRAIGNVRKGPRSWYSGNLNFIMDNSALDARAFSLTGQNTAKPAYNHLQIGGSLGGPLYIPHVLKSNGQFFLGFQTTRNRNANTVSGLMPTEAERNGDFSGVTNLLGQPVTIFDPNTGTLGDTVSKISPQAKALLALYPKPTFSESGGYNYQIATVGRTTQNQVISRLNRNLNSKNFVNGQFAWQGSDTTTPNIFGFVDTTQISALTTTAAYRHIFTTRFNGSLTYNYSRQATRVTPYFEGLNEDVEGNAGITGYDRSPENYGPPALNFTSSGIQSLFDTQHSFTRNQTSAIGFTGLWMPRPHNITFGADFRRQQFNYLSQANPRGTFGFTGAVTGNDFADFLVGIPDTSSIAFGNADKYLRANLWDAYVTDDWRIGPTLTLNVGMRWEYSSPVSELYGRLVNLDIANGFAAESPVRGGNPVGPLTGQTFPGSLVRPDKHGFGPRVAFAWHPFAGSSMVVRGGYGIYYNTSVYQSIAGQMMQQVLQQSPLSKNFTVANGPADPLTLANGFNAPSTATQTFAIDPDFRVGYAQNFQLSVQKDLTDSIVGTITYLGVKGTRAVQEFLPNTYPTGAVNPCPLCPAGYTYMTSNGNSTREAGTLQLRRRMHNGFAASAQYTFSHSFDDAALGGGVVVAQNWLNLSAERGSSSFDQRHAVSATAQYTSGMGLGGGTLLSGWVGTLVKGWTFVVTPQAGTGLPETPIYSQVVQGTGVIGIRPDATGVSVYSPVSGRNLNPAAYTAPPVGQWGNAGRNSIVGPAQFSLNASMARSFNPKGSFNSIDFRFDATNALNHVAFPSWNTTITSAQFGLPMSANAMRVLQATVRMRF